MKAWASLIEFALRILAMLGIYAKGRVDALDKPLRLCSGALAGDDMPAARRDCLPVVAIYLAATGR